MPPRYGLIGSLSAVAIVAALGAPSVSQEVEEQRFVEICSWIDDQNDPTELARIIDLLQGTDECIFDPETNQNYCNVCLALAGDRLATIIVPAGGGIPTSPPLVPPPPELPPVVTEQGC